MALFSRRSFLKTSAGSTTALLLSGVLSPLSAFQNLNEKKKNINGMPFRQVHLDFHTSEHIEGIATSFDPEEFTSVLKKASVNSVTAFARCHHGYMYYNTDLFPERIHPHLKRNLLNEQIEACHKQNIRVPIYTTIQWDHYTANAHPEWLVIDPKGNPDGTPIYEPGFYRNICVNSPYGDFLKKHLVELFEKVPVDGLFLDIVEVKDCSCPSCRKDMVAEGLNPSITADRLKFATKMITAWKDETTRLIRSLDKQCSIFYNGGHVGPEIRTTLNAYTHLELESLPGGSWGYMHFPLTVRYARTLGKDVVGMTGKFHTSWGDFHSFKNPAALQFECFNMLAMNAKCSIGDQLHPNGKIDPATYKLIGSVYNEVEKKEPWCINAKAKVDIGVFSPEEFIGGRVPEPAIGFVRILQEENHQFDVIDSQTDLSPYRLLIMPDVITVDEKLQSKLSAYIKAGGKVFATHQSGLDPEKQKFVLSEFGIMYEGAAPYNPDYIIPVGDIGKDLPETEHVMYLKGTLVRPVEAKVLTYVNEPYFNRTWDHFSSHKNTPSSGKKGYPAVVQNGQVIYFIHPLFTQYSQNAPVWVKKMVLNALNILLPDPQVISPNAPSTVITALNEQADQKRMVLHVLHYIPEARGSAFDVIEDIIPLYNIDFSIKAPQKINSVRLVPENKPVAFKQQNGRCNFTLAKVEGHQMVEIR